MNTENMITPDEITVANLSPFAQRCMQLIDLGFNTFRTGWKPALDELQNARMITILRFTGTDYIIKPAS